MPDVGLVVSLSNHAGRRMPDARFEDARLVVCFDIYSHPCAQLSNRGVEPCRRAIRKAIPPLLRATDGSAHLSGKEKFIFSPPLDRLGDRRRDYFFYPSTSSGTKTKIHRNLSVPRQVRRLEGKRNDNSYFSSY